MNQITQEHKNFRISTPRLIKDRESENKPLQWGNLLIHHTNSQHNMVQMKGFS
jgi:hypothetical protein